MQNKKAIIEKFNKKLNILKKHSKFTFQKIIQKFLTLIMTNLKMRF